MARVRLLTANLFSGRASEDSFEALLDRVQPDLVVCEEVGVEMAERLLARHPHGHAVGDEETYRGHAMVGAVPLDVKTVPLPHRDGLVAEVEIGDRSATVIGVHLANPVAGAAALRDRTAQLGELMEVIGRIDGPLVLAGDMNATPAWPAYRALARPLDDLVRGHLGRSPATWAPRPGWPLMLAIDHVFGRGVAATSAAVHRIVGSDHAAVAVDLEPA